jgi:hypothetical protein
MVPLDLLQYLMRQTERASPRDAADFRGAPRPHVVQEVAQLQL